LSVNSCALSSSGETVSGIAVTMEEGWHSLVIISNELPVGGSTFTATINYLGA
jgi:hypothetical protein